MNPIRFWFAVFTLFGFAVVAPAWMYFSGPGVDGLPIHIRWLVSLMLPMALLLTLASWVQPG